MNNLNPSPSHFIDRKGRQWDVSLDLMVAAKVDKSDFSSIIGNEPFSILKPDKPLFHRLFIADAPLLFAILWAIVENQAQEKFANAAKTFPISPKDDPDGAQREFLSGVNGPVIEAARKAFGESVSDFFPELRTVLSTWMAQAENIRTKVAAKMSVVGPMLDEMVDEEIEEAMKRVKDKIQATRAERLGTVSGALQPTQT